MIFLSFSLNNVFKFFLTIFTLFIFTSVSLYSQTIIKEKVIIHPVVKPLSSLNNVTVYEPLMFYFGGPRPFTFSISGPGGTVTGSNGGWGAPASEVPIPAVYGQYHVIVTSGCECNTNVGYWVTWLDPTGFTQWISGYEMWFYGLQVKEDTFLFSQVPPPPPTDDIKIKISLIGQSEIWPYLPPTIAKNESRGADRPNYNPKTNVKVIVNKGSQPLPNQNVTLIISRVEGTGGHDHFNSLPLDKYGVIKIGARKGNPLNNLTTDQNGEVNTNEILASQVSGSYIIKAILESDNRIKDSTTITVKVETLVLFPTSNSNLYILTGGTCNHHGPISPGRDDIPIACTSPDNNHWVVPEMRDSLLKVLKKFYDYTKSIRGVGLKLGLNDMSLPGGGVFDIYGNWNLNSDHAFHRVGLSVDIDNSGMTQDDIKELNELMLKRGGKKYPESPIHYGFLGGY